MMLRSIAIASFAAIALVGCSQPEQDASNGADDFANRVGTGQQGSTTVSSPAMPTDAAVGGPPENADVKILEDVGYIGGVDLGQRAGTCAFHAEGMDKLMASGPAERTMGGKAVVRIGGTLYRLDGGPGGFAAVQSGTTFRGEGITVKVEPSGKGQANLTVTDKAGQTKTLSGDWNC